MANKRFPEHKNLDYATLNALILFYENGGKIVKAKKTRRPKKGYTVGKESKSLKG
jgi:hypothetical protein